MNISELLDSSAGLQDDVDELNKRFGTFKQLEVIGWSGRDTRGYKFYILKCDICSRDNELFGEGYFKILRNNLLNGVLPCGCSKSPRWSQEQFYTICSRKASDLGYIFSGFVGEWEGAHTKVSMLCHTHGVWETTTIHSVTAGGTGCPLCKVIKVGEKNRKTDEVMIKSFLSTGYFHPETQFWRSQRTNSMGYKPYWYVFCPSCETSGESANSDLRIGKRPCMCGAHQQLEAYIHLVVDNGTTVAVKFGVTGNSNNRLRQQRSRTTSYNIEAYTLYRFLTKVDCRNAERECKRELECGVVLKRDFPDGYTETTWAYNIDKIIEIYERNGGVKII